MHGSFNRIRQVAPICSHLLHGSLDSFIILIQWNCSFLKKIVLGRSYREEVFILLSRPTVAVLYVGLAAGWNAVLLSKFTHQEFCHLVAFVGQSTERDVLLAARRMRSVPFSGSCFAQYRYLFIGWFMTSKWRHEWPTSHGMKGRRAALVLILSENN